MDTIILHVFIILVSLTGLFFGARALKMLPKDYTIISMVVGAIFILINVLAFSIIRIIDGFDNIIDPSFYNWFSLYVRSQNAMVISWIIYLGWRRLNKKK
jgi:hypothetical protein